MSRIRVTLSRRALWLNLPLAAGVPIRGLDQQAHQARYHPRQTVMTIVDDRLARRLPSRGELAGSLWCWQREAGAGQSCARGGLRQALIPDTGTGWTQRLTPKERARRRRGR